MKKAVCALILHPSIKGLYLGISRKYDHTKLGLVGGGVEENESLEDAIIREVFEESNLIISNLKAIGTYVCSGSTPHEVTCFTGDISGELLQKESGILKWCSPQDLINGPFGEYNKKIFQELNKIC